MRKSNLKPFGKHNVYYFDERFIKRSPIVYSCGIGNDYTFDIEMAEFTGVPTYAFDPTPQSISKYIILWNPNKPIFYNIGISDTDGDQIYNIMSESDVYMAVSSSMDIKKNTKKVSFKTKSIPKIMQELNHSHIDVLRMDIEGSEHQVLDGLFNKRIYPTQIGLELHDISSSKNRESAIKMIKSHGYSMVYESTDKKEYTFIRSFLVED